MRALLLIFFALVLVTSARGADWPSPLPRANAFPPTSGPLADGITERRDLPETPLAADPTFGDGFDGLWDESVLPDEMRRFLESGFQELRQSIGDAAFTALERYVARGLDVWPDEEDDRPDVLFTLVAVSRVAELWDQMKAARHAEALLAEAFEVAQLPGVAALRRIAHEQSSGIFAVPDRGLQVLMRAMIVPLITGSFDDEEWEDRPPRPLAEIEAEVARLEAELASISAELDAFLADKTALGRRERASELGAALAELFSRAEELEAETDLHLNAGAALAARLEQAETDVFDRIEAALGSSTPQWVSDDFMGLLPLAEAQALLRPDEALLLYLVGTPDAFAFAIRPHGARLERLPVSATGIAASVDDLRQGLDPAGIIRMSDIPSFDIAQAHALYRGVFAPLTPFLAGVRHLLVVPHGPLHSLPFGVLVASATEGLTADPEGYRATDWLVRSYAKTLLPAASSLRAREHSQPSGASKPFVGFGDPMFHTPHLMAKADTEATSAGQDGIADTAALRALAPLPETAVELYLLADALGADATEVVFLRDRATERRVRSMDLSDYRIVAFATHGLTAGEVAGTREAGLVLTPPHGAGPEDDGFLAASEIAQLVLDAEWVILSACNTAAGETWTDAGAAIDIAAGFFFAGARAILMSHWAVPSDAAVALTSATLLHATRRPESGRAEALRRAMLDLMHDPSRPSHAHPAFWAPFSLMGDG